jgi:hypothetical protein
MFWKTKQMFQPAELERDFIIAAIVLWQRCHNAEKRRADPTIVSDDKYGSYVKAIGEKPARSAWKPVFTAADRVNVGVYSNRHILNEEPHEQCRAMGVRFRSILSHREGGTLLFADAAHGGTRRELRVNVREFGISGAKRLLTREQLSPTLPDHGTSPIEPRPSADLD